MPNSKFVVLATESKEGWSYGDNYFPRSFNYRQDAINCAEEAIELKGTDVRIEKEGKIIKQY